MWDQPSKTAPIIRRDRSRFADAPKISAARAGFFLAGGLFVYIRYFRRTIFVDDSSV